MLQPERLLAAERASALDDRYPWQDAGLESAWQKELGTLQRAVLAKTKEERVSLARQFLQERQERRAASGLSAGFVDYERQQEWLEGLAKYAELSIGLAAADPGYQPLPEALAAMPGFKGYAGYAAFYRAQLREVSRTQGRSGYTRFYYSGMAQVVLLDELISAWKPMAMQEGACLEDLLADAVGE